jgi:aldose 1-epimerase
MVARISNFGGVVVDLIVPDRHGKPTNVVLGYDDLASYEKGGVYSALIGPYANRLGLKFPVDGQIYQQPAPAPRPVPPGAPAAPVRNFIQHSGANGFQKRVWEAVMHDGAEPSLSLTIKNPDGIGGMPGNVTVTVTYTVRADNTLVLDYKGATDRPTVMNLTNHFYFNLNGGVRNIDDEQVTVFASRFTPYDRNKDSPSGVIASVFASPYDFTKPVRIGDRLSLPDVYQPVGAATVPGYDAHFLVDGLAGRMRRAARVYDPDTGIVMVTSTTEPGVQFYTDNIAGQVKGRNGATYGNHWAISLETGKAPDTPNHPNFPSAEVKPAKPLHETTEYRFGTLR